MKAVVWLLCAVSCLYVQAGPEKLELVDGRVFEQVSYAEQEDGKIRVQHSGGVTRVAPEMFTAASRKALGLPVDGAPPAPALTRVVTLDGKAYEGIRSLRVKPSFISFVYQDGAAKIRFENLAEDVRKACGYDPATAAVFDVQWKKAEEALARAEAEDVKRERKVALAAMAKERRIARREAYERVCFTNYGSLRYWGAEPNQRYLVDTLVFKVLTEGGWSSYEARDLMNELKFR